ncbi:CpaF family protein [Streptacidiphilus albus]|uniref:CpaF family protein n=1 Tax=Streptacidiphilus albus TaxID=105425 RepID=UPI0009DCEB4A|nr:ATPase, T2SS/T4P/T4SS family [Streptacidiphilus albus]
MTPEVSRGFSGLRDAPDPGRHRARGDIPGQDLEWELAAELRERVTVRLVAEARRRQRQGLGELLAQERRAAGQRMLGEEIQAGTAERLRRGVPLLEPEAEQRVVAQVESALFGMGVLERWLADPELEDLHAIGCDNVFARYADGRRVRLEPLCESDEELVALLQQFAATSGQEERRFDRASPQLNLQLPDGSRLFALMAVSERPSVTVRKHRFPRATLRQLREAEMFGPEIEDFLRLATLARKNITIAGGTKNGKTTLLRAIAAAIPPEERIVTVEDTFEIGLNRNGVHANVVALQAREANLEGAGEVTQAQLVRWGLRMSPDRVIVGEVRGSEVVPMCNAMSQGNDGSLSTIHSSTSRGVFTKFASYAAQGAEGLDVEATNLLVASALHFVVQLGWDSDRRRCVTSIREIVGADGNQIISNEVYRPGSDRRAVFACPLQPETQDDFDLAAVEYGARDPADRGSRADVDPSWGGAA